MGTIRNLRPRIRIGWHVDPVILEARETRRRTAAAREEARRQRRRSIVLIRQAEAACERCHQLKASFRDWKLRTASPAHDHRFVVLVEAVQVHGVTLRRGDVVADTLVDLDFGRLASQRLVRAWEYPLSELVPPSDPWQDGRWMG